MSVQTSSGGTAGDKHFVDTVGAWTSKQGSDDRFKIIFQGVTNTITGQSKDFNQYFQVGLTNLTAEMGYAVVRLFHFYKISSMEFLLTDLDYGSGWTSEKQMWNIWMAPWKNTSYQASSTLAGIYPNYIPGCIWKNLAAPSCASDSEASDNSSSIAQMLYMQVMDPVFEIVV